MLKKITRDPQICFLDVDTVYGLLLSLFFTSRVQSRFFSGCSKLQTPKYQEV